MSGRDKYSFLQKEGKKESDQILKQLFWKHLENNLVIPKVIMNMLRTCHCWTLFFNWET